MASEQSLWFRIGYALERAKHPSSSVAGRKLTGLAEARRARPRRTEGGNGGGLPSDELISAAAVALAGKLLEKWRPRRKAGISTLLRAGVAGAGAAFLLDLLRPLLSARPAAGRLDRQTSERLVGGVGQGLLYGAIVEPRLPGPPVLKGALFGTAEYAADPAGGLTRFVAAPTLHGHLPRIGQLLVDLAPHDRSYVEHVTFGIALALLYGSSPSSSGMIVGDDDV